MCIPRSKASKQIYEELNNKILQPCTSMLMSWTSLWLYFHYHKSVLEFSWREICYVYIATCNKKFIEPFFLSFNSFLLTLISSHNFPFLSTCLSHHVFFFFSAQSVYDNEMTCKREKLFFGTLYFGTQTEKFLWESFL